MRIISRAKVLLAGLAAVVLLAGCGSGPSQVGSAAIVGDRVVPVAAVQDELNWLIDHVPQVGKNQDKLGKVSRRIVRGRVIHELVSVAARRAGLRLDQAQVADLLDSAGGKAAAAKSVGVAPGRVQQVAADQVLLEQLGKHYLGRLSVSFIGTVITAESPSATAEEKAVDLAHRIAAHPKRAGELVRGTGQPVRQQDLALRDVLRKSPGLAVSAVFGAQPGTVVAIKPSKRRTGWLVALVTERTMRDAGAGAEQQANPQMLYQVGMRMLQPIADDLGVRINPRYGVWDATAMRIFPSAEEVSGHQLPSRTVRS